MLALKATCVDWHLIAFLSRKRYWEKTPRERITPEPELQPRPPRETRSVAVRMMSGSATLDEIQEALRTEARNPQMRLSVIETACTTVGLGADGRPGFAARMFLTSLREGLSEREALARACVHDSAFELWMQDPEFRGELDRTRRVS
ncbi:MAG TPA: hypothetical protein VHW04_09325 [Solirubrobacteraceae bacterium]|jgi:hypothetical protein|nr:hypothetical protein [Solirubrobacteraceae bacterium]